VARSPWSSCLRELAAILPLASNIVRFGRLFHVLAGAEDGDGDVRASPSSTTIEVVPKFVELR